MEKRDREALEDLLEAVWLRREAGKDFQPARYRSREADADVPVLVARLVEKGLLEVDGDRALLTPAGDEQASKVVRRHRLAERLFSDLFQADSDQTMSMACRFEHILNSEVTEAVCTLLGHPPTCPHGRRIPPGPCCRRSAREVKPLVQPLGSFMPGSRLRIVFITPRFHARLDRLNSFGVLPGAEIQLHQKRPSFVIRVDETEVAIEREIADEIYAIRLG